MRSWPCVKRTTMRTLNVAICRLRSKVLLAGARLRCIRCSMNMCSGKLRELSELICCMESPWVWHLKH